jgi:[acyl-carrier-protein] S-malonyltransferase
MRKLAFVFPGQGVQSVGMGKDLYQRCAAAAAVFDTAGEDLKDLCFNGPQSELDKTENAQPSLFVTELACAAALNANGIMAQGLAGFSLGEIPALAHSGLMSFEQAFDFVRFRAKIMQECAGKNPGGMLAVLGLSAETVINICNGVNGAYPANFNSDKQTVVAFAEPGLDDLKAAVTAAGGKAVRLATSGAFHCLFMNHAADAIAKYMQNIPFGEMRLPLYANTTARVYDNPAELLSRQVNHPVLWRDTIENMINDGFDTFIEAGPGKVLAGLIKKINKDARVFSVYDGETLENSKKSI